MVAAVSDLAIVVDTIPLDMQDAALGWLEALSDKRIVALGEATHGTREFFQMKYRIFRYLVEHHQFQAIGMEADFAESFYLDAYVQGGPGNLEMLMQERMHFWTWRTKEVRDMIQWMRQYNAGLVDEDRVHFMGFDCQFMTYQPVLLKDYLGNTLPDVEQRISTAIGPILQHDNQDFAFTTEQQYAAWQDTLVELQELLETHRGTLTAASSHYLFEMHKHLLRNLAQVLQSKYHIAIGQNLINWRDQFMGENALWYVDLLGQQAKACMWAHNAHVARNDFYGGSNAMGNHMAQSLGDDLAVIAFGFTGGTFTAVSQSGGNYHGLRTQRIDEPPRPVSINYVLDRVHYDAFTLDLRLLVHSPAWQEFLSVPRLHLEVGSVFNGNPANYYREVDFRRYYDYLIYYQSTLFAEQL